MLVEASIYPIGAIMILAGLNNFRAPVDAAVIYGLPFPAKTTSPNPWQYVFAARNVYVGVGRNVPGPGLCMRCTDRRSNTIARVVSWGF